MGYVIEVEKTVRDKELKLLKSVKLENKFQTLLEVLQENPFKTPPRYEKLVGNLNGKYSRRLNIQHRIVYSVDQVRNVVRIYSVWSHYE